MVYGLNLVARYCTGGVVVSRAYLQSTRPASWREPRYNNHHSTRADLAQVF